MNKLYWTLLGVAFTAIPTAFAAGMMFSDVHESDWYHEAVMNLNQLEIVEGYQDDTYKPENNVNRAEMAVVMDRLITYLGNSCANEDGFYLPGEGYETGSDSTGRTGYECQDGELVQAWVADPE